MAKLHVRQGGSGDTLYVLLHGLSCTGSVWRDVAALIERDNAGRWIAPDMRGHGQSEWETQYGTGQHAADLAPLLKDEDKIRIIGHSMGSLIGLALASGIFGVKIQSLAGIGTKCRWPQEEREKLNALAAKPSRWFESQADAIRRYLLVSGLKGLIEPGDERLTGTVVEGPDGWRLAADPMILTTGGPPEGLYAAAVHATKVQLACGETDNIVTIEELRALDPNAHLFAGRGHSVHVEDPEAVWAFACSVG
jgi:pimeloyl-ACP methyl ester carboxylesterase